MTEKLPTSQSLSPEAFQEPEFEYELLVGHARTDGSWKTSEQLRTEYIQLTDGLIHKMTYGVEVEDPLTNEYSLERPDYVVWFDKSARPVSWLTEELWPLLAADQNGNVPKMPSFKFVNIDREQWVNKIDPTGEGYSDISRLDPSVIQSLRSIFVEPKYKTAGLSSAIEHAPSELDNKTILLIDEVRSSGRTLDYGLNFFRLAFPTAQVTGTYWMGSLTSKGGAVGNADLPVWYRENTALGRGVGNRDDRLARQSPSLTQRLGASFLSNRLAMPDEKSIRLHQEIHQLAEDAENGKVLVIPSIDRDMDDFDERAQRLNHLDLETFTKAIKVLKSTNQKPIDRR